MTRIINASGAVVGGHADHREVLVVHRPPTAIEPAQGQMLPTIPAVTAVREVGEETGHQIRLRVRSTASYPVNSHIKVIQWWLGELATDEVGTATTRLTRRMVVMARRPAISAMTTRRWSGTARAGHQTLFIRHAKAMNRKQWQDATPTAG